jgi:uroporphyrinogen decarboxylase
MTRTMTSRERVKAAFALQTPDRVPVNYKANAGIDSRLKAHFGLKPEDNEGLLKVLNVDFREANPPYIGPKLHPDIPERGVKADHWGIHRMWIEHGSGGYWDFVDFPLQNATEEEVARWPLPSPDDFNYDIIPELCRKYNQYAIGLGHAGCADVMNSNGMLRTMEQTYVDLALAEPAGLLLAKRRTDIQLEWMHRTLEKAKGRVDYLWIGEDMGTQTGPLISMDTYREHLKPIHQKFIDLARAYNLPIVIHTCGASSWVYEELIQMGINVVDTLQPEAKNMAPEYLKKTFGGRLAFHGCISTAGPVAYGNVSDMDEYCRKTLATMMPGGGYCFAPTHSLQDNSPTENVVAMYQAAIKYGVY